MADKEKSTPESGQDAAVRRVYLVSILASITFVWALATIQLKFVVGRLAPHYYLIPTLGAILFGLLLARLQLLTKRVESQKTLFQGMADNPGEFTWLYDHKGQLLYASSASLQVLGIRSDLLVEQPYRLQQQFGDSSKALFQHHLAALLQMAGNVDFELNLCTVTGVDKAVVCQMETLLDEQGRILGVLGRMKEIRQRDDELAGLKEQLRMDEDTGLANWRLLNSDLDTLVLNPGRKHILVHVHLAGLRHILGLYGPAIANRFVMKLAQRIKQDQGSMSRLYRAGKGRLALLLEDTTEAQFRHWITHFQNTLEQPVDVDDLQFSIGMRAGVAMYPMDAKTREQWQERAELAMRVAMESGESWTWFNTVMEHQRALKQQMEQQLLQAVTSGKLQARVQAIYRATNLQLVGVELKGYWCDTHGVWHPLEQHVEQMRHLGLTHQVLERLLGQLLPMLKRLEDKGVELRFGLNIQVSSLLDRQFTASLRKCLEMGDVLPKRLVLEVRENSFRQLNDYLRQRLEVARSEGFSMAVDHFGSDLAALKLLDEMPVQIVKVDTHALGQSETSRRLLLGTVIHLGQKMGLDVVLNGLQSEADLVFARESGADFVQGPYLHELMSVEAFERWYLKMLNTHP